jgi:hypothetical protein
MTRSTTNGVPDLLELPWFEDDVQLIEDIRQHGTLFSETLGDVALSGDWHDRHRNWYNPAADRAPEPEPEPEKRLDDAAKMEEVSARSASGLRAWERRRAEVRARRNETEWLQREADRLEEERRLDREREWAIHTSNVEGRIEEIIHSVADANGRDRATMRAMLRYMNLGEGRGTQWDARTFALHLTATRRDDLLLQTVNDIERCYDLLKNRYDL